MQGKQAESRENGKGNVEGRNIQTQYLYLDGKMGNM